MRHVLISIASIGLVLGAGAFVARILSDPSFGFAVLLIVEIFGLPSLALLVAIGTGLWFISIMAQEFTRGGKQAPLVRPTRDDIRET